MKKIQHDWRTLQGLCKAKYDAMMSGNVKSFRTTKVEVKHAHVELHKSVPNYVPCT